MRLRSSLSGAYLLFLVTGCTETQDRQNFNMCPISEEAISSPPVVSPADFDGTWDLTPSPDFDGGVVGPIQVASQNWQQDWVMRRPIEDGACLTEGPPHIFRYFEATVAVEERTLLMDVAVTGFPEGEEPDNLFWNIGLAALTVEGSLETELSSWLSAAEGTTSGVTTADLSIGGDLFATEGVFGIQVRTEDEGYHGLSGVTQRRP